MWGRFSHTWNVNGSPPDSGEKHTNINRTDISKKTKWLRGQTYDIFQQEYGYNIKKCFRLHKQQG